MAQRNEKGRAQALPVSEVRLLYLHALTQIAARTLFPRKYSVQNTTFMVNVNTRSLKIFGQFKNALQRTHLKLHVQIGLFFF